MEPFDSAVVVETQISDVSSQLSSVPADDKGKEEPEQTVCETVSG